MHKYGAARTRHAEELLRTPSVRQGEMSGHGYLRLRKAPEEGGAGPEGHSLIGRVT